MAQATQSALDAQVDVKTVFGEARTASAASTNIRLSVYDELSAIEQDWRAFEQHADCTVFQAFDWLATWQRHIGARNGIKPAIVVGRDTAGNILFLLPLAVDPRGVARRLTWLGSDLCDYNAPLLAKDFSLRVSEPRFAQAWRDISARLRSHPELSYDAIHFEKMLETIGEQHNPFCDLPGGPNPSGAYLTHLTGDWEAFYTAKRSSTTRRRDRTKRKKMAELGEVRFVTPVDAREVSDTLDTLIQQKTQQFARMGVRNIFAPPGHRDFYRALASDPAARRLVHISRLDVGSEPAAANVGLIFHGRYYHLLASYGDGEASRFGPGVAHLHDLMRYAIEQGCHIFDFTIGDEPYKRDWCDTELKLYDHVSAASWRGALVMLPLLIARNLKRTIKQTPVLWNAVSKARSFMGSLRKS